jgi:hypothetical protein
MDEAGMDQCLWRPPLIIESHLFHLGRWDTLPWQWFDKDAQ